MSSFEAEDILSVAAEWAAAGEQVAVATVTDTWGSSASIATAAIAPPRSAGRACNSGASVISMPQTRSLHALAGALASPATWPAWGGASGWRLPTTSRRSSPSSPM